MDSLKFTKKNIKLSICIPVYNNAKYLIRAIESATSADIPYQFEVVVVDDNSTDDSWDIINKYQSSIISKKNDVNYGMVGNWNECVRIATGNLIVVMGADDIIIKTAFLKSIELLISNPSIALCAVRRDVIDQSERILLTGKSDGKTKISDGKSIIVRSILSGTNIIGEPVVCLFRKTDYVNVGGFTSVNNYTPDICMWTKLAKVGSISIHNIVGAKFRISTQSNGAKTGIRQIKEFWEYIDYANSMLGLNALVVFTGKFMAVSCFFLRAMFFFMVAKNEE